MGVLPRYEPLLTSQPGTYLEYLFTFEKASAILTEMPDVFGSHYHLSFNSKMKDWNFEALVFSKRDRGKFRVARKRRTPNGMALQQSAVYDSEGRLLEIACSTWPENGGTGQPFGYTYKDGKMYYYCENSPPEETMDGRNPYEVMGTAMGHDFQPFDHETFKAMVAKVLRHPPPPFPLTSPPLPPCAPESARNPGECI